MKIIRDNIWGDIPVSDGAIRWIDTEEFQRLHHIRQTGMAYRVFPTATVSRFAHSVGAYHVVRLLMDAIGSCQPEIMSRMREEEKEWIALAALLHDIGHGPFSHTFDRYLSVMETDEWSHHENRSIDMIGIMTERYGWRDVDVAFIQSLIDPIGHPCEKTRGRWFEFLVANPVHGIDVDKMDYLVRDNHQFGLSMMIDIRRILRNTRVIDNTLCFCDKVQDELWNLFLIRHRLHSTIYRHPRIIKFENELHQMFEALEPAEGFYRVIRERDMARFLRWTDAYILVKADPILRHRFDTRTSVLEKDKEYSAYKDHQFHKLHEVWFYDRKHPSQKFHLQLPSPFCPFSIPI